MKWVKRLLDRIGNADSMIWGYVMSKKVVIRILLKETFEKGAR